MKKLFILCITAATCLSAQAQNKFLWFTGHWSKDKKNVFVIDATTDSTQNGVIKMPAGNTVTIAKNGSITIGSACIDDWNKKIDDGEKDLDKTIKDMTSPGHETEEWAYHFNKAAMPMLDSLKADWKSNKIDKKGDALNPELNGQHQNNEESQALKNSSNSMSDWCKTIQPKFQAIADFYHAHAKEKYNDLTFPAPPEYELKCMNCDSTAYNNYLKQCDDYVKNFSKPESDYVKDALSIMKKLLLVGRSQGISGNGAGGGTGNAEMDEKLNPLFNNSGSCGYFNKEDLGHIVQWLMQRLHDKADKLVSKYEKEDVAYKVVYPVQRVYMGINRQCALLGVSDGNISPEVSKLAYNAYMHYYTQLVEKHDWSQLYNIPQIFSLYKNYALVSGNTTESSDVVTNIFKILNSFQLNVEMDIKIGKNGEYFLTHLKGKAKITPEFDYNKKEKCYNWVIAEDQPDGVGQPVKKLNQKMDVDLLDNEMIVPKGAPVYTGTKKYWCSLQQLNMDFCNPGKDTILLSGFSPNPSYMAGTWKYPGGTSSLAAINGLDHFFQDIIKMKALAQSGAVQQQENITKEQAEKLEAQMKKIAAEVGNKRDPASIAKYQEFINKMNSGKQLFSNQNIAPMMFIDFPLQIQNNTATLFNKRFNAKEINPTISDVVVYGYYTVDIEYKQ